jgi:hypothetical protein
LACDAENTAGQKVFGHYEGYVFSPYQILGILFVVFTGFLFISSLIVPKMYSALQRPDDEKPRTSIHAAPEEAKEKFDQTPEVDDADGEADDVGQPDGEIAGETVSFTVAQEA